MKFHFFNNGEESRLLQQDVKRRSGYVICLFNTLVTYHLSYTKPGTTYLFINTTEYHHHFLYQYHFLAPLCAINVLK